MKTKRHKEVLELIRTNPVAVADMLVSWETELSKAMPRDFKDWWQNSKTEWPLIARLTIESLREREQTAWDMLDLFRATKEIKSHEQTRTPSERLRA